MLRLPRRFRAGGGDKSPLSIAGDSRGVLCLHGITGTPFEIRPLAEALGRRGCTVLAPMLAGHGGTLGDLAASGWPDWLASAEAALDSLQARVGGGPVAICGFSMGGLLALRLARHVPRADRRAGGDVDAAAPAPLPGGGHPGAGAAADRLSRAPDRVCAQAGRLRHLRSRAALREPRPARVPDRRAGGAARPDGHRARRAARDPHAHAGRARAAGSHGADGGFAGADRLPRQQRHRTAVARQVVPHRHPRRRTRHRHRRGDAVSRRARGMAGGREPATSASRYRRVLFSPAPCKT